MSSVNTESGNSACHEGGGNSEHHYKHDHIAEQGAHAGSNAHQELLIEGAGGASCVGKIESALKKVLGVATAEKEKADQAYYKRLMKETWIMLSRWAAP